MMMEYKITFFGWPCLDVCLGYTKVHVTNINLAQMSGSIKGGALYTGTGLHSSAYQPGPRQETTLFSNLKEKFKYEVLNNIHWLINKYMYFHLF